MPMRSDTLVFPAGYHAHAGALPFLGRIASGAQEIVAGDWIELALTYEVGAAGMADGAWLKIAFRFYSDWGALQTEDAAAPNYVSAELNPRPLLDGETPEQPPQLKVRFDPKGHERPYQKAVLVDLVDGYLRPGDRITVRLGDRRAGSRGTRAQTFVEDQFRIRAFVDPVGTSRFAPVPGDVVLRIVPGPPSAVRVTTPRLVRPGTPFPVHVRAEDAWGNTCRKDGARFRLLQPDQPPRELAPLEGAWAAARTELVLDRPGEALLTAELAGSGLASTPTPVTAEGSGTGPRAWFADLHVHSHHTVGTNSTDYNLRYGRDVAGLDVLGYTANDFQITEQRWNEDAALCRRFTEPDRFVCFPGTEWNGNSAAGGDRNVVFIDDRTFFPRGPAGEDVRSFEWSEDVKGQAATPGAWPVDRLHRIYREHAGEILMIPHVGGRRVNLDWHDPRLERLVEVASAWGHFPWLYQEALARGYRVGVSAAGDEHRGRPGGGAPGVDVFGVRGGLTGFLADRLTTAAVRDALFARHTWATTGDRLVALLRSGRAIQGDELAVHDTVRFDYRLFGTAGWEEVSAFTNQGLLWRRDLHGELGRSPRRIRFRWGGARIKDRYRWARWSGRLRCLDGTLRLTGSSGFEHPEELAHQLPTREVELRSDTYGDADGVILEVDALASARFQLEMSIQAFSKSGSPLQFTPHQPCPRFTWEVTGRELIDAGAVTRPLPGTELFAAFEVLTEQPLPRDLSGSFELSRADVERGVTAVYVTARQVDDAKVWTSPIFLSAEG